MSVNSAKRIPHLTTFPPRRRHSRWPAVTNIHARITIALAVLSIFLFAPAPPLHAQIAETLAQVKKIYIEPFGQEADEIKLRARMVEQLERKGRLQVVNSPSEADAVIKGSGSIWVVGYVSNDPRSRAAGREAVLTGFLSTEVIGKNGEPLWSYLVTPSRFAAGDITNDLVDHLVAKLAIALTEKTENVSGKPLHETTNRMTLTAAGATFPAPLYQEWFETYEERHPNLSIQYSAVGSGTGLQLLRDGKLDFAASDMPLSDETMGQWGRRFQHFASVVGGVVPVYNLKGVDRNLNFTPEALAGIYLGKIHKWNDPLIRESNRNVALPNEDIVVIHRSDGSGTTFVLTDYLSKVSPEWKASVGSGTTVQWPLGTGAEGNEGVAMMVQQRPNSIGYVELTYALRHRLSYGAVRNISGQFVQADLPSVTIAASDALAGLGSDFRVSITNAPEKGAYPITSFTWWLVPQDLGTGDKRAGFLDLLQWMLTSGQKECSALGYAPLPREVADRELQLVSKLKQAL